MSTYSCICVWVYVSTYVSQITPKPMRYVCMYVFMYVICMYVCVYVDSRHSHTDWGPRNSFQRFWEPVYYWKSVNKPETDPQLVWERQYFKSSMMAHFSASLLQENRWKPLKKSQLFCNQQWHTTANLKIIDVRYRDFNGFPVVNWYWKPLKTDNGRQLFWD